MKSLKTSQQMTVAAAVALAIAMPAFAQDAEQPTDQLAEVRVTGSRIVQAPGMFTPTPVTAVVADELKNLSPANLIESLNTLPVFSGNSTQQVALGGQNSGGSNVNLHGVGQSRTLVLLDGRRVVASNRFSSVDVNTLPDLLLQSVETVTGGASASYGTDAVAGVVNFKLDTKFEGVKLRAQGGTTSRHDGDNEEYGFAFGHGMFNNRLHFIGSLQYSNYDPISDVHGIRSRPWFQQQGRVTNPDPNGPNFLRLPHVQPTNFATRGLINDNLVPSLNKLEWDSTGTSVSLMPFYGVGSRDGGCLCQSLPTSDLGVNVDDEVAVGYRRTTGFARLGFNLTDNTEIFAQGIWAKNSADQRRESVALLQQNVWQGRIYSNNAFLTPDLQTRIFNGAANPLPAAAGRPPVDRTSIDNTTGTPQQVRWVDFSVFLPDVPENPIGDTRQDTANHMRSVTLGFTSRFEGNFLKGWTLDGYVQRGDNRQDFNTQNGIRVDRLFLALDAVRDPNGNIVCRAALPQYDPNGYFRDCRPINLFGGMNTVTPEAAAYIRDDYKIASQWIQQTVGELSLSGDLGFGLPAGDISTAVGVSYRKDELNQRTVHPDDEYPALPDGRLLSDLGLMPAGLRGIVPATGGCAPNTTLVGVPGLRFVPTSYCGDNNSSSVQFSSLRTVAGSTNVKEAFTEFQIPLVKNVPALQRLDSNIAARWADYSGSGTVWAWKGGLSWEIDDQFRVRGTRSRDVRAANLRDRFDSTRGGFTVTDNSKTPPTTVSGTSFSGGNPLVKPEKADTTTAGIVFQPSFLEGFQASVDWYSIKINDAISQLNAQTLVNSCNAGDQFLCQFVIRASNGDIVEIDSLFINLNEQKIEGIDMEFDYRRSINLLGGGPEQLSARLFGTYTMHNSIQSPGGPVDEIAGQVNGAAVGGNTLGGPKWKGSAILGYRNGPYSATLIGRYIGDGILDRTLVEFNGRIAGKTTIDDNHVGSAFYTDLSLSFTPEQLEGLRLYGTVTNLFDHAPPQTPGAIGRTGVIDVPGAVHDVIGRRFVVGAEYRF
jgi:outer membrane receptor protein involved in Fe transport